MTDKLKTAHLLVSIGETLRTALQKIEQNHFGVVFVSDENGSVIGAATDGDIRRLLLADGQLEASIETCMNKSFIWVDDKTPREAILKQLDHHIKVVPILSSDRKLVDIVSKDYLPTSIEKDVYVRARAPVRISFGGGGSDLTYFFSEQRGAVINSTISFYSHATLRVRKDMKIHITSRDLGEELMVVSWEEIKVTGKFGLLLAVIKTVHPDFGFDLFVESEFPMGSGLGGSAVVSAAVLGCFNQLRQDRWDSHELAELAYQAERIYLGIAGGWQDQYATVFGGMNFIEFAMDQNIVHPLRIKEETILELEESLVLCDTSISHNSGKIHDDQRANVQRSGGKPGESVRKNVELTYRMRDHLLRGRLRDFGLALHEGWMLKREFSSSISSDLLDEVYNGAIQNGAIGGKLLGAGGGGFFLFYAPAFSKAKLVDYLESKQLNVRPFRFDNVGLKSWTVRSPSLDKGFL
jgi:D-glycero-alpha-D-manno-heptose-7-phosphate kinase